MKHKTSLIILLAAAFPLLFTACKKNTVKPASSAATLNYGALSGQLATSFYKAITGQYGGTDVSKGVNSPFSSTTTLSTRNHLSIFDSTPLCGFIIDTTYNNAFLDQYGNVHTNSGSFKFQYTCDAGTVNGYVVDDNVSDDEQALSGISDNNNSIQQSYTVKALNTGFKLVSMDGTLSVSSKSDAGSDPYYSTSMSSNYTLTGLQVNYSTGTADVTSGAATFHMVYYPIHNLMHITYTFDGTIQFLGNHMAKLTVNNQVFLVNLITGVATPA